MGCQPSSDRLSVAVLTLILGEWDLRACQPVGAGPIVRDRRGGALVAGPPGHPAPPY